MSEYHPVLHVLCRTARRPMNFRDCFWSWADQTFGVPSTYFHVGVEDDDDLTMKYVSDYLHYDNVILHRYDAKKLTEPLFYNDFLNQMHKKIPPSNGQWVMYLDDDDWFVSDDAVRLIQGACGMEGKKLAIWKCKIGEHLTLPRETSPVWGRDKFDAFGEIATFNWAFRADLKEHVKWESDRDANYLAFRGIHDQVTPEEVVWLDSVLTGLQDRTGQRGWGRAKDREGDPQRVHRPDPGEDRAGVRDHGGVDRREPTEGGR